MYHTEIKHIDEFNNFKSVIHGQTVGRDGARTLCGEDTSGDHDRIIVSEKSKKKITCPHCIELIVGVQFLFTIDEIDIKALSNNKTAVHWIEQMANKKP